MNFNSISKYLPPTCIGYQNCAMAVDLIEKVYAKDEGISLIELFQNILSAEWHKDPVLRAFVSKLDDFVISKIQSAQLLKALTSTALKCHESFQRAPFLEIMPHDILQVIISFTEGDLDALLSVCHSTKWLCKELASFLGNFPDVRQKFLKKAFVANRLLEVGLLLSKELKFSPNDLEFISGNMTRPQFWQLLRFVDCYIKEKTLSVRAIIQEDLISEENPSSSNNNSSHSKTIKTFFANALSTRLIKKVSNLSLKDPQENKQASYVSSIISLRLSFSYLPSDLLIQVLQACPYLQELDLENCQNLSGELIKEIATCKNLKKLTFSKTSIQIKQLACIASGCPELEELDLSFCHSTKRSKSEQKNPSLFFANLKKLSLCGSSFDFTDFRYCPKLEELDLTDKISIIHQDTVYQKIATQSLLKKVILEECSISDENLSILITGCPNIQELFLGTVSNYGLRYFFPKFRPDHRSTMTEDGLNSILQLKDLRKLSLKDVGYSDKLVTSISKKFSHFPEFEFSGVQQEGFIENNKIIAPAGKVHFVKTLLILASDTNYQITAPKMLRHTPNVEDVTVFRQLNNRNIPPITLDEMYKADQFKKTRTTYDLDTTENVKLSQEETHSSNCQSIKNLSCEGWDDGWDRIIEIAPNIENLNLSDDVRIRNPESKYLETIPNLAQIKRLRLAVRITDDELVQLVERCPKLEELYLDCIGLDGQYSLFAKLALASKTLKSIIIQMADNNWLNPQLKIKEKFRKQFPYIFFCDNKP